MNQILASVFIVLLFVVLTPGVYLTIPRRGSKLTVAVVHGLLFALVLYITHTFIFKAYEGFVNTSCGNGSFCPPGLACSGTTCTAPARCTSGIPYNGKCYTSIGAPKCPTGQSLNSNGLCYYTSGSTAPTSFAGIKACIDPSYTLLGSSPNEKCWKNGAIPLCTTGTLIGGTCGTLITGATQSLCSSGGTLSGTTCILSPQLTSV